MSVHTPRYVIFVCLLLNAESTFVEKRKDEQVLLSDVTNKKKLLNVVKVKKKNG